MDGYVVVFRASGLPEAEIVKGYLENHDIPVDLAYESVGPAYGLTIDGLGEVRLRVPEECEQKAKDLIERQSGTDPETDLES